MQPQPNTWCHIEIHANDTGRAKTFYGEVFGWNFQDIPDMDYCVYSTVEGAVGGGLCKRTEQSPPNITNYVNVDSIEETCERVGNAGGKVVSEKIEVPNMGWLAFVQDTEGNTFGLWKGMGPQ